MISFPTLLEWSAFLIGTVGTVLWAANVRWRGRPLEGWLWLASSILWIWFATLFGHGGLAARDLLGASLYIAGIWRAFRRPPDSDR